MMDKEILRRYFENKLTEEEAGTVEKWLSDSANMDAALSFISSGFAAETNEMPVKPFEQVLEKINARKRQRAKVVSIKSRWLLAASAACVLFLIFGGWLGFYFNNQPSVSVNHGMNSAQTSSGQYAQVTLSDGSEVFLAGNSKLYFPDEMNVHPVVYLDGEAYFELQNKKLTIKTKDIVATAKNSKLNISAFSKDSLVTVTVEKGKAEVRSNGEVFPMMELRFPGKDSVVKKPKSVPLVDILPAMTIRANHQATYDKETKTTDVKPVTIPLIKLRPANIIRNGSEPAAKQALSFYRSGIVEVSRAIEQKYGVQINLDTHGRIVPPFTGRFEENELLTTVLDTVCKALGLQYQVDDKLVTITVNP